MEELLDCSLNINHVSQEILISWPLKLPVICAMKEIIKILYLVMHTNRYLETQSHKRRNAKLK